MCLARYSQQLWNKTYVLLTSGIANAYISDTLDTSLEQAVTVSQFQHGQPRNVFTLFYLSELCLVNRLIPRRIKCLIVKDYILLIIILFRSRI